MDCFAPAPPDSQTQSDLTPMSEADCGAGPEVKITRGNLAGLRGRLVQSVSEGLSLVETPTLGGGTFLRIRSESIEPAR
jgi:hypothetical protein